MVCAVVALARRKPFLQIKCWDQRRALAFPGKSFMAKARRRESIFIVVANSFTRCLQNSRPSYGKPSLCEHFCCYLGENTQQTTKLRQRLKRKAHPKGSQSWPESLCKHHMKETEAQWTGNCSVEPDKKIGLGRRYFVRVSVASWMFHIESVLIDFDLKGRQKALWFIKVMFAISISV